MERRRFDQFTQIFLVNASQMAYIEEAAETQVLLQRFIELFKYFTRTQKLVALADEMTALQNYIDIQRVRYGNRFEVSFTNARDFGDFSINHLIILDFFDNILSNALVKYEKPVRFILEVTVGDSSGIIVKVNTDVSTETFCRDLGEEMDSDVHTDDC